MALLVLSAALIAAPVAAQECATPHELAFEVEGKITRSQLGFTQGLEFRDGQLYESTGSYGGSTKLNLISLSGQVKTLVDRGASIFGEGLTLLRDEVFQLTWQDHMVFVYDRSGKTLRTLGNPRDGWGLANDGTNLIFSDGGPAIYFADPATFAISKSVKIRLKGAAELRGLNELEFVDGKLFGNIFMTDTIVRLDPATGCVDATADLAVLRKAMSADELAQIASSEQNVLNGIAHDGQTGRFYLTGKRWKSIFIGRFVAQR
jgi:glutamine cyclotransferase